MTRSMNIHSRLALLTVAVMALFPLSLAAQAPSTGKPQLPPGTKKEAPQQVQKQVDQLSKIKVPPLPPFHPQEPKRIQLSNGMVVFLQEDHELPLIGGTMRIRGGDIYEPAEKTGLVDIYGTVWRTGGTKTRTGDQLDDYLEAHAAKVETNGNDDSTTISFDCLKGDFDGVFPVFNELLREPAFREDKIDLIKRQLYGVISRRNDDVDDIASREAAKLAYGKNNPYARVAEYATVAAVTRQDLVDWHEKYVQPANIIFGVYGDFDSAKMEKLIRQTFESWPAGTRAEEPKIDFDPAKPGIYFVAKNDIDQSSIQLVGLGITRRNPDYYAVTVMNEVLSGGFASRLISNLRSKLGLAYSVGGGIGSAWDHPGMGDFSAATKSSTTKEMIDGLKRELNDMTVDPPTPAEMKRAKDAILNSFVFNFDSKQKVLAEKMRYEFYGYPLDFLEHYRSQIEKVTVDDVNRVAKKYIHPDQFPTLVVGNSGEIGNQLTSLGPVTPIDISIPPPPGQPGQPGTAAGQQQPPSR
ncbi:MAG: M16 family metallopeptidase [Terriglobales bacterium]